MSENDVYLDEIIALRRRLADIEKAAGHDPATRTYTTAQLEDRGFWEANKADILRAAAEGRIVDAEPIERPAPVYPPSIIPGWRTVGQDHYIAEPPEKGKP